MDLQRALHKLNPASEFRLNHSQADDLQAIVEWRGPGAKPAWHMIEDAWDACLVEDAAAAAAERERAAAVVRVKANAQWADLVKVLRL